jgi:hypothetical protein
MLYHWNMIEPHDEKIHRESMLMPLLFTSMKLCTIIKILPTQQPKRHNFERNSYKMALKIAPAEIFLLNVQPESRQAIGKKSCTNSTICTQGIYRTKERFLPFVRYKPFPCEGTN